MARGDLPLCRKFSTIGRTPIGNLSVSYIRSTDAALYYEEYGSGETLILLPGFLGTIESDWRRFIPEFARHFHVISVDLRGHGKTNNPSGELPLVTLIGDLHTIYETLEIDSAFLCTHGFLGSVVCAYAIKHPERVRGIIVHAAEQTLTDNEPHCFPMELDGTASENLRRLHEPANGPNGWAHLVAEKGNLVRDIATLLAGATTTASILVPILLTIGAEESTAAQHATESIARMFPGASIAVVAQSSRELSTVQKQPFVGAVVSFVRDIARAR